MSSNTLIRSAGDSIIFSLGTEDDINLRIVEYSTGIRIGTQSSYPSKLVLESGDGNQIQISPDGITCDASFSLNGPFYGLVNDFVTYNTVIPASANALAEAYASLSNVLYASNTQLPSDFNLIDDYLSTSMIHAPTANSLRRAYQNLSNSISIEMNLLRNSIPLSIVEYTRPNSNIYEFGVDFKNDIHIISTDDKQSRFFFTYNGSSKFLSPGIGSPFGDDLIAFEWIANDTQSTLMSLSGLGNCSVPKITTDDIFCKHIHLSDVNINSYHSNLGINTGVSILPQYSLHVEGNIYAKDGMFKLSDRRYKTNLKQIKDIDIFHHLDNINGYCYNDLSGRQQYGLLAQEVKNVFPQIVHDFQDEKMSIDYDQMIPILLEAIKSLHKQITSIKSSELADL